MTELWSDSGSAVLEGQTEYGAAWLQNVEERSPGGSKAFGQLVGWQCHLSR